MAADVPIKEKRGDAVNHPDHYNQGGIECIDAIEAATASTTMNPFEGHLTGTIIKYLWRWKLKAGAQDLKKAEWYLRRLIQHVEGAPK